MMHLVPMIVVWIMVLLTNMKKMIMAKKTHGTKAGQWSARKAQYLAKMYKEKGGGYKD